MCKHTMTMLYDGQEFCVCGVEIDQLTGQPMELEEISTRLRECVDMDDSCDEDNDTDYRHEMEWEHQTYEHYSGDHT